MTGSVHTTDPQQVELPFKFVDPVVDREASIEEKFEAFHAANPWVYTELVRMTRELVGRGHRRVGMKMLFENLRYSWMIRNVAGSDREWRLNNNYTAHYARLVMRLHPEFDGVFETRVLRA